MRKPIILKHNMTQILKNSLNNSYITVLFPYFFNINRKVIRSKPEQTYLDLFPSAKLLINRSS